MAKQRIPNVIVEDAKVLFRNFKGEAKKFNAAGDRNFCVLLDPETASQMSKDGWNIKTLKAREPGEDDQPYIQVSVGYKVLPPRIVLIGETSGHRQDLGETLVSLVDDVVMTNVDVIIRPYEWQVNDDTGVKAYVKTMFVTIEEDYLELKYNQAPGGAPAADNDTPPWDEEN